MVQLTSLAPLAFLVAAAAAAPTSPPTEPSPEHLDNVKHDVYYLRAQLDGALDNKYNDFLVKTNGTSLTLVEKLADATVFEYVDEHFQATEDSVLSSLVLEELAGTPLKRAVGFKPDEKDENKIAFEVDKLKTTTVDNTFDAVKPKNENFASFLVCDEPEGYSKLYWASTTKDKNGSYGPWFSLPKGCTPLQLARENAVVADKPVPTQ
ncbi:MAG: hypothetical protein M1833_006158 [Piccolia ochrophora]|nr:MAG: hypothetical protein M1833_006158 [Piccolia ochrophora]